MNKIERKIYHQNWYHVNKENQHNYRVKHRQDLKLQALFLIGKGKIECSNCGCKDIRILEINHVNGGGNKEIKNLKGTQTQFITNIIYGKRKIDDLNILCKVCNSIYFIKQKFGIDFKMNELMRRI